MVYRNRFIPLSAKDIRALLQKEEMTLAERILKSNAATKEDLFIDAIREVVSGEYASSSLTVICKGCNQQVPVDMAYLTRAIEMKRRESGKPHICGPHCLDCHGYIAFEIVNASEILRKACTQNSCILNQDEEVHQPDLEKCLGCYEKLGLR